MSLFGWIRLRKFIISDIHGNGNVYYSIMNYLDNISKDEEIILYINGDLIDRGIESAEILLDIKRRIEENRYKIIYLGGNHELLMYKFYEDRKKDKVLSQYNDWYDNGGWITDYSLDEILNYDKDEIFRISDFVGELNIYYKFSEKINGKNIVLVHAACPMNVSDNCNLKIKDDDSLVNYCVWTREYDPFIPFRCRIGNDRYFSIVGHTPNDNKYGYVYNSKENYINIDGGCSRYVSGDFSCDHVPLIEIKDNYLKILTFNNNNEIIYGNYFDGNKSIIINDNDLDKDRRYLNKKLKIKKLVRLDDNIIGYEDWK